jgi:hypothetical protein
MMEKYYDKINNVFNLEVSGLILGTVLLALKLFFSNLRKDVAMWLSVSFTMRASSIAKIHICLRKLLYRTEGDRASLFNFSGGIVDPSNKTLLMTCISEVLEDGIGSASSNRRAMNVKQFEPFLEELIKDSFIIIKDSYDMLNSALSGFLLTQGTRYSGFKLIRDNSGNIYGFICIEFCRVPDRIDDTRLIKELGHTKDKIALLL